jgi:hypothetical protein
MIVCPNCQHHNADADRTCARCHHALSDAAYRVCTSCGALNPLGNLFCHRCLSQLAPDAVADVAAVAKPVARAQNAEVALEPQDAVVVATPSEIPSEAAAPGADAQDHRSTERREAAALDKAAPVRSAEIELASHPLDGLADTLPLETAVALPRRGLPPPDWLPTAGERLEAELLLSLASQRAPLGTAAQTVGAAHGAKGSRAGRLALHLLVLLVALVPLLSPGFLPAAQRPSAEWTTLLAALDQLDSDATVLLAVEYGPTYAGELDPLAHDLLERLAAKDARVLVLSTKPEGIGMARRLLSPIGAPESEASALRYTILGLVPGQESGVRALGRSLQLGFPSALAEQSLPADVRTLRDCEAVILLTDDSQLARAWIEQAGVGPQLLALVTARIAPLLLPYRTADQLGALVSGEASATAPAGSADGTAALVALLIVLALAANWPRRTKRAQHDHQQ